MNFQRRDLTEAVEAVRGDHAPGTVVLDAASDFESLDPGRAENLGLVVDTIEPASYPGEWLPEDTPQILQRYASDAFVVGLPGDGSVAWTRQTNPPVVIVKPRVEGSPGAFVDFLVAEALVEVGLDLPESFLAFFGDQYRELAAATPLSPAGTYQLANALFEAWKGLHTREAFAQWDPDSPLGDAWADAGQRLVGRLDGLSGELARGETEFPAAAELACGAVKHALDLPAPFSALGTRAYRREGPTFAVEWAERTFEELSDV